MSSGTGAANPGPNDGHGLAWAKRLALLAEREHICGGSEVDFWPSCASVCSFRGSDSKTSILGKRRKALLSTARKGTGLLGAAASFRGQLGCRKEQIRRVFSLRKRSYKLTPREREEVHPARPAIGLPPRLQFLFGYHKYPVNGSLVQEHRAKDCTCEPGMPPAVSQGMISHHPR